MGRHSSDSDRPQGPSNSSRGEGGSEPSVRRRGPTQPPAAGSAPRDERSANTPRAARSAGTGDRFGFAHREPRSGRRGAWIWGLAALIVVLAVTAGVVVWRSGAVGGCGDRTSVTLAADPAITDAMRDVAAKAAENSCFDYTVNPVAGADVPGLLTSGDKSPDLWVPDSQVQARRITTQVRKDLDLISPSVAATPVVVVGKDLPKLENWVQVMKLDGLQSGNPIDTSTGDAPIIGALAEVDAGSLTDAQLIDAMTVLAVQQNNARPTNDTEGTRLNIANTSNTPVISTEQQYTRFTRTHPGSQLKSEVPADGTVMLDFPLVNTAPAARGDTARDAGKALTDALSADGGTTPLTDAGFRAPGDIKGITVLTVKDPAQVDKALRQWQVLGVPIRTLVAIDTSGSMADPVGDTTRAGLTIDAALTGLKLFPNNTEIGGWAFGIDKGGPGSDWKELSPIRRLDAKTADGTTHRDELASAVEQGLAPSQLGGGTPLYDTTLAAFKKVQDTYDPNYSNSVIIMTDGENEDPNTISLNQLISDLKRLEDPARPVLVLTIGISSEADTEALDQIAEATGGTSYVAKTPDDIKSVFVNAIRARVAAAGR